jgi:3',5'-cyclic AMP phosphodiesterase CpdA
MKLPLLPLVCGLGLLLSKPSQSDNRSTGQPLFRFGVIADVQYADKEPQGNRRYRAALEKLQACVAELNRQDLAFVVNLGDLIDGQGAAAASELATVAGVFAQLKAPVRHVIGNHCLEVDRPALMKTLKLRSPYYEFEVQGWRFIVLDGMDISVKAPKGSVEAAQAQQYLARSPGLPTYNGAIGPGQLAWLKQRLAEARQRKQKVVVFCHHPSSAAASTIAHTLWNAAEVESALAEAGCVAAYFAGHDHQGGYARHHGIHHVTIPGLLEAPENANAYAVVEVFADQLAVRGVGTVPSRVLPLPIEPSESGVR